MEFVGERRRMFFPSGGTLFSAYASMSATFTLLQQAFYQFIPSVFQDYICDFLRQLFSRKPSRDLFKLIIEDGGVYTNQIFEACQVYLCNRLNDSSNVVKVSRLTHEDTTNFTLAQGVKFSETFEGIDLNWSFHYVASSTKAHPPPQGGYYDVHTYALRNNQSNSSDRSYFSLVFDKKHKQKVCTSYLSFVMETSKDILHKEKTLKLIDCNARYLNYIEAIDGKHSVNMNHPFTFNSLAIDHELKKAIMDDLDRFLRRKEFYRRVGKPWKRGYLLYGPPGTGKSSLIAAMANYLKFDVHDLRLGNVDDSSLRSLLLMIPKRSIIVIEDIDCTGGLPKRDLPLMPQDPTQYYRPGKVKGQPQMSLAALLNFVDGLWSCCGDERLIVFTTNHKEKLDPVLLRPGRMDMHIHLSYLTMSAFKILANNYLQVSTDHPLFEKIERLLECVNATPAEVAEELLRSEDAHVALQGVVELLKRKQCEAEDAAKLVELVAEKEGLGAENAASGETCDEFEEYSTDTDL